MTHADINDLETRDYIFKIGDRRKGIQARYDKNTDALIFSRATFDYVYKLLKETLSQEPTEICCATCKHERLDDRNYKCEFQDECLVEGKRGKYEFAYAKYEPIVEQEPCDDAISRQAVNEIKELMTDINGDTVYAVRMSDIRELPSVTQKSGKWIWVQYDSNPNIGNWHCPECRTIIPHMPEETDNTPIYKWCPMCGARMVEPQERSDKE